MRQSKDIISDVYDLLDYSLELNDRIDRIKYIDEIYGEELSNVYSYYSSSNLNVYENRMSYDNLSRLQDTMSEYILFATNPDETEEALNNKRDYPYDKESNLKPMMSDNILDLEYFMHVLSTTDYEENIEMGTRSHESYTLKYILKNLRDCPFITTYIEFSDRVREIIKSLDSQLKARVESGETYDEIVDLKWHNYKTGHTYYYTAGELGKIKKGVGYTPNNCMELDQDVVAIYREWYKPIDSKHTLQQIERKRVLDLDFMDYEHVRGLILASCLTGWSTKFDKYVKKLDGLFSRCDGITNMESSVYSIFRNGNGNKNLVFKDFERNMVSLTKCGKILGVTKSRVHAILDTLTKKIVEQFEMEFEDWYFTNLARGTYKTCKSCRQVLLLNDRYFSPRADKLGDGYYNTCKKCERKR